MGSSVIVCTRQCARRDRQSRAHYERQTYPARRPTTCGRPLCAASGATAIYQFARKLRDKSIAKNSKALTGLLLTNSSDLTTDQNGTLREIKRFGGVLCKTHQLTELDAKLRHFTHPSPTPATAHPAPSPLAYPTTAPYGPGQP